MKNMNNTNTQTTPTYTFEDVATPATTVLAEEPCKKSKAGKIIATTGIVVATAAAATAAIVIVMKKRSVVSVDTATAFMNMGNGNF